MNQNKIMQSNLEVIAVRPLRLIIMGIINAINNITMEEITDGLPNTHSPLLPY